MADATPDTIRSHCNSCFRETNHLIVARYENKGTDDGGQWQETSFMLKCCGCDTVSFRIDLWLEAWDDFDGDTCHRGIRTTNYPAATSRRKPPWAKAIPEALAQLLEEVYIAYAADARSLATMGIRAILDGFCNDKVGDCGNFKQKLDALVSGEFVSSYEREILEAALDAGHAAAHRGHSPTATELSSLLDIVEHFLQAGYVLRQAAQEIKKHTPTRPKPN